MNARRATVTLALLALAALALGTLVYALDRGAGTAVLWPRALTRQGGSPVFGAVGGSLPSLAHAFAFSLLSALALPWRRAWQAGACAGWAVVDALFEIGQHRALSGPLGELLPPIAAYLRRGTFDPLDVAAGCVGAALAYMLLRRFAREHAG